MPGIRRTTRLGLEAMMADHDGFRDYYVRSGGPELALELEAKGYGPMEAGGREAIPVSA